MDIEQKYRKMTDAWGPILEKTIKDELSECTMVKNFLSEAGESPKVDGDYITVSTYVTLMTSLMRKICSEVNKFSKALIVKLANELNVQDDEEIIGLSKVFNVKNPEILALISNDFDPNKMHKYLTCVIEKCFTDEFSKLERIKYSDLKIIENKVEKYIPVTKLEDMTATWIEYFSSAGVKMMEEKFSKLDGRCKDTLESIATTKEKRLHMIENINDMLIHHSNLWKEAKVINNYDALTHLDDVKISKLDIKHFENYEGYEKLKAHYENKRPSVICCFASLRKKQEIISNRKQLKGKGGPISQ